MIWIARIFLGAIFIYAGWRKLAEPGEFADAIAGFQVTPLWFIHPLALGLPLFEVLLGLCLFVPSGNFVRRGALGIALLNILFIGVLGWAWATGLSVECGCFGFGLFPPSSWTLPIAIGRDFLFLAAAWWIWKRVNFPRK